MLSPACPVEKLQLKLFKVAGTGSAFPNSVNFGAVCLRIISVKNSQVWGQQEGSVSRGDCNMNLQSEFNIQTHVKVAKMERKNHSRKLSSDLHVCVLWESLTNSNNNMGHNQGW